MNRRNVLRAVTAATIAGVAGCVSTGDDGNSGGGDDGGGGTQISDIVELPNHEWRGASILEVTVRNVSESTVETMQVDVNMYDGDERVGDGYWTITELPPGVEETVQVRIDNLSAAPCESVDTYDIVPNFYFDGTDYEDRREYDYDPEFCEE